MDQWPTEHLGLGSGADPFSLEADSPPGALAVVRARAAIAERSWSVALTEAETARAHGVPAELAPHLALAMALAHLGLGESAHAQATAQAAWREYPDFAALPAILGLAAQNADQSMRFLIASLASEDPDQSLLRWAPAIQLAATRQLGALR